MICEYESIQQAYSYSWLKKNLVVQLVLNTSTLLLCMVDRATSGHCWINPSVNQRIRFDDIAQWSVCNGPRPVSKCSGTQITPPASIAFHWMLMGILSISCTKNTAASCRPPRQKVEDTIPLEKNFCLTSCWRFTLQHHVHHNKKFKGLKMAWIADRVRPIAPNPSPQTTPACI